MKHGVARLAAGPGDRLREEQRVLVRVQVEVDAPLRLVAEVHGAESFPRHQVARHGEGDTRTERAERHVRHDVQPESIDVRDAGILDAAVVRSALPRQVRREHDATPLHPHRHTVVNHHLGEHHPRDVPCSHHPRQQVEPTVGGVSAGRVEHALGLQRIVGIRRHHDAEACQPIGDQPFTPDPMSLDVKWRWKMMNNPITGAASTHAPAITDPNGLATVACRLDR